MTVNSEQPNIDSETKKEKPDPFTSLLQTIEKKAETGEGSQWCARYTEPFLNSASIGTIVQGNGALLTASVNKGLPHTVRALMQQTDKWPKDVVQSCMLTACKHGYDMTLKSLLNNTTHCNNTFFTNLRKVAHDSAMRSTLKSFEQQRLGEGWTITADHEIERKNKTMTQIFNFAACHVTTIIQRYESGSSGKSMVQDVMQRDFTDFQSDGEIVMAHRKLEIFSGDLPPYRGKDLRSHRKIKRQPI